MKISSINLNKTMLNSSSSKLSFKDNNQQQAGAIKNEEKVPKRHNNLENWIFGLLTGITVLQIINLLINSKKGKIKI